MKTKAITIIFFLFAFGAGAQTKYTNAKSSGIPKTTKNMPATGDKGEKEIAKKIVQDLIAMNIITDTIEVTFTLSDKKMEVNHKEQPDEIFTQFKEKYLSLLNVHFPELVPADSNIVTQ